MNRFAEGGVGAAELAEFKAGYESAPQSRLLTNALYRSKIEDLAISGATLAGQNFAFSVDIKTMPSTSQKNSGRCWLFAATNCMREVIAKQKGLEDFELSQSWLAYHDKFERANFFLESIIATAGLDADDRTVAFILSTGVQDGGQWDMFVNIVRKYGICPKSVYPETAQSSGTKNVNYLLNTALRRDALILRGMHSRGASGLEIRTAKNGMLSKVYAFLTCCYGRPPERFDFEGCDKDGKYFREEGYTPLSFRDAYFGDTLESYVSLINAPTCDKPFGRTYTVDFLGNVAEARPLRYLNLEIGDMKGAVLRQLEAGEPVWFGSDCSQYGERLEKHLWDPSLYDYESVSGLEMSLSKGEMLDYHVSAMNHAMVITGVNIVNGKPTRWKVQNSWGRDDPNKGYYFMTDAWFDAYVFQVVVNKKYLGESAALFEQDPIVLKPWDPMGTLAD